LKSLPVRAYGRTIDRRQLRSESLFDRRRRGNGFFMGVLFAEILFAAWGWGGYWWWWWWWIVLVFFLWAIFLPPFGWGRRWYGGYRSNAVGVANSPLLSEWQAVESQFVDSPANAVTLADQLVTNAAAQSGARLSASAQYQQAHAIAVKAQSGQADDRELRQAMMLYRSLLQQLVSSSTII
jgi:hypothetical protein